MICLLLAAGVLLLLFSGRKPASAAPQTDVYEETAAYRRQMEEELSRLCESVEGVGSAHVSVSLAGGCETVYATDAAGKPVMAGGSPVVLYTSLPQVVGVAVTCSGGGSATVRREVTGILCALLGIGSHCVWVSGGQ